MAEPRRFFTVARANRALPLVSRVVDDLVRKTAEFQRLEKERATARHEALETVERKLFDLEGEIEHHLAELANVGCEVKDPTKGLLDFIARRGNEMIYLCWMKGESEVAWWHAVETGFAGRRPVSELPPETRGE